MRWRKATRVEHDSNEIVNACVWSRAVNTDCLAHIMQVMLQRGTRTHINCKYEGTSDRVLSYEAESWWEYEAEERTTASEEWGAQAQHIRVSIYEYGSGSKRAMLAIVSARSRVRSATSEWALWSNELSVSTALAQATTTRAEALRARSAAAEAPALRSIRQERLAIDHNTAHTRHSTERTAHEETEVYREELQRSKRICCSARSKLHATWKRMCVGTGYVGESMRERVQYTHSHKSVHKRSRRHARHSPLNGLLTEMLEISMRELRGLSVARRRLQWPSLHNMPLQNSARKGPESSKIWRQTREQRKTQSQHTLIWEVHDLEPVAARQLGNLVALQLAPIQYGAVRADK